MPEAHVKLAQSTSVGGFCSSEPEVPGLCVSVGVFSATVLKPIGTIQQSVTPTAH